MPTVRPRPNHINQSTILSLAPVTTAEVQQLCVCVGSTLVTPYLTGHRQVVLDSTAIESM